MEGPTRAQPQCRGPAAVEDAGAWTPRPPRRAQRRDVAPLQRKTLPRERLLGARAPRSSLRLWQPGRQSRPDKSCLEEASAAAVLAAGGLHAALGPPHAQLGPDPMYPVSRAPCSALCAAPRTRRPRAPAPSVPAPEPGVPCGSPQPLWGAPGGRSSIGRCWPPLGPCMGTNRSAHLGSQDTLPGGGIPHASVCRGPGDTPRSPQPHATGHPRGAAPPDASTGWDVAAPHLHPVPGRTRGWRAGTRQGSPHAPGAQQVQLEQQPGREGVTSRLHTSHGLCHQLPKEGCTAHSVALLDPQDHQPPTVLAREPEGHGRVPEGDEPPPAPGSPKHRRDPGYWRRAP